MNFIIRRIVIAIITVFLVSILCFLAFSVIRGDPATYLAGINASQEQLSALRQEMGLNRNVVIRYLDWLSGFVSGRAGVALSFRGEAISTLISQRLPITITLALLSLFFVLLISIPVSLLTVNKKDGVLDGIINFLTAAGLSTPGFFMGMLFIFIFGFGLKLFIPGEYIDYNENFWGFLRCLCFPALAISIPNAAILVKFLRGSLFAELRSEYVTMARSKGAGGLYILRKHVLKNALLPAVTIFAMIIAEVFSGSIIIEQVFTIPGLGRLLISAISSRDYPLIQSLMVYIAFIIIAANTLADIAIMIIDPRIREARDLR